MADMTQLRDAIRRHGVSLVTAALPRVKQDIQAAAPHKTGGIVQSVKSQSPRLQGNSVLAVIEATADHAEFQDRGTATHNVDSPTGPYTIVPVNARVLRFQVGSEVVFTSHVLHPGVRPQHFFEKPMPGYWEDGLSHAASTVTTS